MKETIQYAWVLECAKDWKERNSLCNRLRQNQNQRNEKHTFTHTNTAKSYDAITCVRIKYHTRYECDIVYAYIPQLICQFAHSLHSLLLLLLLLHSLWITNSFRHLWLSNCVWFRIWMFIQLMVLFWNGSLFDWLTYDVSEEIDLNTHRMCDVRIVVCCRCYCHCCYCLWTLLSFCWALFVQFTIAMEFSIRFTWTVRTHLMMLLWKFKQSCTVK